MIGTHLRAGLAAARRNLIPGLVLQALLVAMLLGWWLSPTVRDVFEKIALMKMHYGYAYSFLAGAIASGVLPEALRIIFFQGGRFRRDNASSLAFGVLFWGAFGILVDAFYRLQGVMFGNGADFATVASKVAFDMLVFTPVVSAPMVTIAYAWKHAGYRLPQLDKAFYRDRIVPVLIPNWVLWVPIICVIYAMPAGLQIPIWAVAMAFWTLLLATITYAHAKAAQPA
ncbi:MAG: hypothetical protein ACREKL_05580 [Chthoniobacterales bacterium]